MDLDHAWEGLIAASMRDMVLKENLRVDGRGLIDHREAYCRTGHLPVVHGSAISNMGETQVQYVLIRNNLIGDTTGCFTNIQLQL